MDQKYYIETELVNDGIEEYNICSEEDGGIWVKTYDKTLAEEILSMMNSKK